MQVFSEILGSNEAPEIATVLHRLDHMDAVDELLLPRSELSRKRFRARTRAGRDVAVALPRDMHLFDGAVLELSDCSALVVRVETETWLRISPADTATGLALGYHAGNLHWRVRFERAALLVALEGPEERYRDRLRDFLEERTIEIVVVHDNTGRQTA